MRLMPSLPSCAPMVPLTLCIRPPRTQTSLCTTAWARSYIYDLRNDGSFKAVDLERDVLGKVIGQFNFTHWTGAHLPCLVRIVRL